MLLYLPFITFPCISEEMRALEVKSKRGHCLLLNFFSVLYCFWLVFVLKNMGSSIYIQLWLSIFRFFWSWWLVLAWLSGFETSIEWLMFDLFLCCNCLFLVLSRSEEKEIVEILLRLSGIVSLFHLGLACKSLFIYIYKYIIIYIYIYYIVFVVSLYFL